MKWFRWIVLAVALLAAAGGLFYWFLPASVAVPLLARRTHGLGFEGLSGTLWNGRADRVLLADGRELGTATWRLGRQAILGRTDLDMHLEGRAGHFDGHMDKSEADRVTLTGVSFRLDAAALAGMGSTDDLVPSGVVEGRIPHAELQGNWPMTLEAAIVWKKAALRTPEGYISLGGLLLDAASTGGVLRATLRDDGEGSLAANAVLAASPLGWRIDGKLAPRLSDSALSHLIARFGPVGRDGSVNLQRKVGLAPRTGP